MPEERPSIVALIKKISVNTQDVENHTVQAQK